MHYTEDLHYYNGYMLDSVYTYELTDKDIEILNNACALVDNTWSLRGLSRNCGRSRSQLSRDFQHPLKNLSYELYQCVKRTLQNNKAIYFK